MSRSDPTPSSFDLRTTYVVLDGQGVASELVVDDDFWTNPKSGGEDGRLVSVIHSAGDWPTWEMHPRGDEVICLLSGAMTLILDTDGANRTVEMTPGRTFVVPAGAWHTADVTQAGDALYITVGAGTQQRPRGRETV